MSSDFRLLKCIVNIVQGGNGRNILNDKTAYFLIRLSIECREEPAAEECNTLVDLSVLIIVELIIDHTDLQLNH